MLKKILVLILCFTPHLSYTLNWPYYAAYSWQDKLNNIKKYYDVLLTQAKQRNNYTKNKKVMSLVSAAKILNDIANKLQAGIVKVQAHTSFNKNQLSSIDDIKIHISDAMDFIYPIISGCVEIACIAEGCPKMSYDSYFKQSAQQIHNIYTSLLPFIEQVELSYVQSSSPIDIFSQNKKISLSLIQEPLALITTIKQAITFDEFSSIANTIADKFDQIEITMHKAIQSIEAIPSKERSILTKSGIDILHLCLETYLTFCAANVDYAYNYYSENFSIDLSSAGYYTWHHFIKGYVDRAQQAVESFIKQSSLTDKQKTSLLSSYKSSIAKRVIPLCCHLLNVLSLHNLSQIFTPLTNSNAIINEYYKETLDFAQLLFIQVQRYNKFLASPIDQKSIIDNMIAVVQRVNDYLLSSGVSNYDDILTMSRKINKNYDLLISYSNESGNFSLVQQYTLYKQALQRIQHSLNRFNPDTSSQTTYAELIHDCQLINYTQAIPLFLNASRTTMINSEHNKEKELAPSLVSLDDVVALVAQGPLENPYNAINALKDVQTNIKELVELCNTIIQPTNNIMLKSTAIESFNHYTVITSLLNHCLLFFNNLEQCVTTAQLATSEALSDAESLYETLIQQAQKIDVIKTTIVTNDHPFIQKILSFSYQQCAAVFVARCYVWTASTTLKSSPFLQTMRYYVAARAKSGLLPTALNGVINSYFLTVSSESDNSIDLMNTIKQKYDAFISSSCQKMNNDQYENYFTKQADNLIHLCWIAYCWGQKKAFSYCTKAIHHYLKEYGHYAHKEVMRQAKYMSIVNIYALILSSTHQTDALLLNNYLQPITEEYTANVNNILETILMPASQRSLSAKAAQQALNAITAWQQSVDWLLSEQITSSAIYGNASNTTNSDALYIVHKKLLNKKQTVFTFYATNNEVTVPSSVYLQSCAYQRVADQAFNKQDYQTAQQYYQKASHAYKLLNDKDKATANAQLMAQSKTLYLAHYYNTLVASVGAITIGNFQNIPLSYTITAYEQIIPTIIAQGLPVAQSITDKQRLDTLAIATALKVFIYNSLNAHYSLQDAQAHYTALQTLLQNNTLSINNQSPTVSAILNNAQQLQNIMRALLPPVIEGIKSGIEGQNSYKLWEYNLPIDPIPLQTAPYVTYPNAFNYYNLSCLLYGSKAITIGGTRMAPGNKPEQQKVMKHNALNTWLSYGHRSQQAIDVLRQSVLYQQIQKQSNDDLTFKLDAFKDLFEQIYNLYGPLEQKSTQQYPLWVSYAIPLNHSLELLEPSSTTYKNLLSLVASTYKNAGDDLSVFLKGDPLSSTYNHFLKIIVSYYQAALQQGYDQQLYDRIGQLYTTAAASIQSHHNYFSAISYFENAQSYYQKINSSYLQSTKKSIMVCQVHAAVQQLVSYALNKQHPLSYIDDEGTQQTIRFTDLMNNYQNAINQDDDLDDGQQNLVNNAQNTLLNALIVLSSLGAHAPAATSKAYVTSAHIIDEYMKNSAIGLSGVAQVEVLFLKPSIASLCMNLFTSTLNDNDANTALLWASRLYNAGMLLYMNDFLGGVSSSSFESLNDAIGARAAAIQMNPALSIG